MKKFNLSTVQKALTSAGVDGWLFYDFQGSDPISRKILHLDENIRTTRRWIYNLPAKGVPVKLVHSVEKEILNHLPGKKEVYVGWRQLDEKLKKLFTSGQKVCLQYSPHSGIPSVSRIDAGIYELLKSFKLKMVSSAGIVQQFTAKLTSSQINSHVNAAKELQAVMKATFRFVRDRIRNHEEVNEKIVQEQIKTSLKKRSMVSDFPAIVATGKNTSNPHYLPADDRYAPIFPQSLLLIEIWGKEKGPDTIYADQCVVAYTGAEIPREYADNFSVIREARDFTLSFIDKAIKKKKPVTGWQADDAARSVIAGAGMDSHILHRSGHTLGNTLPAYGVNLDNLETRDERNIISNLCLSIGPGVYFPDYGMRTEINAWTNSKGIHLSTTPVQEQIEMIKI